MNKKRKKMFLSLVFFVIFKVSSLFTNAVWAQDEDIFRYPLTPEAMNTFNLICAKIAEKPIVKGNFSQEKYLSRFGRSLNSSGNFIIAKELGMAWETNKPFPSTMILGSDFILQSRPDGQKSVLSAQGNETFTQMSSVISAVFSGNSSRLLENFDVFFFGNVSNWRIGLMPKNSMIASFASKITMSGDCSSNGNAAIRSISIYEQNGDIITYTLSNHSYPTELNNHEKAFFQVP